MVKKLVLGAAVAALLAPAAFAQSYQPSLGSGNIVPPFNYEAKTQNADHGSYAYEPAPRPKMRSPRARSHRR
jgi:opacity protein-like surface antigen